MTEIFEVTDAFDRRLALGADGLLQEFNEAGVLTTADVHVARRLGSLYGERDETTLLAVAMATRAVRLGSVCVELTTVSDLDPDLPWPASDDWSTAVTASPLVNAGVLRVEFGLLYLDRYWQQEVQLCTDLTARMARPAPAIDEAGLAARLERVFPGSTYDEQRAASAQALRQWTTVVTGGPGTGKTTTVAGLLALLVEQAELSGNRLRIGLAAPTGKAAARLQEAVHDAASRLPEQDRARVGDLQALTLHRLLGTRRDNGTRFRHHRANRLPHDIVVVDESSMVSLTLMTRLVEAMRSDARLILVGDPDQLASVEAGAVLADLVTGLAAREDTPVARLTTTHRFGEEIGRLAAAIRDGEPDDVLAQLRAGATQVQFAETADPASLLRGSALAAALEVRAAAREGRAVDAVEALGQHRLLCAHREGPYGVRHWNRQVEHWISEATGDPLYEPMYVGRPLLVTANDYGLGVYNGDSGVVVRTEQGPRAVIAGAQGVMELATSRMSDVETMFATTIHKSQGSQADNVTLLLPPPESRLLTRELFYTAVTRARRTVTVVGSEESVRVAVERRAQRASGLRQRISGVS